MKNRRYILAGWSMGIAAVGAASLTFPAIAQKAVDQREDAQWMSKAAEFAQMTDIADLSRDSDIESIRTLTTAQPAIRVSAQYVMEQHKCLSEAVYYEARSETRSGQIGVAEVIMNRVSSKHYPNTICDVVFQGAERRTGCQFSFTCDGSMEQLPKGRAWQRSQDIATLTLTGLAPKLTHKATHYHTTDVNPPWAETLRYNGQIGSHKFYRFKWKERNVVPAVSMSIAPPI